MKAHSIETNISQMHLVRAIACLGVVITHTKFVLWSGGQAYLERYPMVQWKWYEFVLFFLDLVTSIGSTRVFFFFILSGFFLQYSTRNSFCIRSFLRGRFLRLYPSYVMATLAALAAFYLAVTYINPQLLTGSEREFNVLLRSAATDLSWPALWHTLLFNSRPTAFAATPHLWSMLHEALFCLLFPLYHCLSMRERAMLAVVVLGVSLLIGSQLLQAQLFFLIGMLFYDWFSSAERPVWELPRWGYKVAFAGLYLATYGIAKLGAQWLACLPMVLLAFLLFEFVLYQPIQVPRVCVMISKASYAIYLNHLWIVVLYYAVLSRLTGELVFYSHWPYYSGVIVAVLVSLPVYWLVDKPIAAYLVRLRQYPAFPAQARAFPPQPYLSEEYTGMLTNAPSASRRPPQVALVS
jgi:peptidoglycan/LPS O-acetylase OafA/YrhL